MAHFKEIGYCFDQLFVTYLFHRLSLVRYFLHGWQTGYPIIKFTACFTFMAVILMLCASASFATMSAFVKAIGPELPIAQLMLFRCLIPLPFFAMLLLVQSKPMVVKSKKVVLLRSIFGFLAMAGFYYALTHMPLADCIFIGRAQPLLLALMSPFVIGEKAPRAA